MRPLPTDELIDAPDRTVPEGHALVEIGGRLVTVKTTPPPPLRRAAPESEVPSMVPPLGSFEDDSLGVQPSAKPAPVAADRVAHDLDREPAWLAVVACVVLVGIFAGVLFLG